jgi:hypothetical protein
VALLSQFFLVVLKICPGGGHEFLARSGPLALEVVAQREEPGQDSEGVTLMRFFLHLKLIHRTGRFICSGFLERKEPSVPEGKGQRSKNRQRSRHNNSIPVAPASPARTSIFRFRVGGAVPPVIGFTSGGIGDAGGGGFPYRVTSCGPGDNWVCRASR